MGDHVLSGALRDCVKTGSLRGDRWMASRLVEELSREEALAESPCPSLEAMRAGLEALVADIDERDQR